MDRGERILRVARHSPERPKAGRLPKRTSGRRRSSLRDGGFSVPIAQAHAARAALCPECGITTTAKAFSPIKGKKAAYYVLRDYYGPRVTARH